MKKSLVALAIAGTLASSAYAETAVTIYGIVDMGLVSERGSVGGSLQKLSSGAQSGTRLGFKGTEDLGNNMKALFVLETAINGDSGSLNGNGAFGRQSFVGLQSDLGTVTLGRQYTPYFLTLNGVDPFASGMAGAAINLMAHSGVRMSNTVKYASPNIAGFTGELAYGFGEVAPGQNDNNRQIGAAIGYAMNPVNVRLAYNIKRNSTDTASSKNLLLGATWDLQVAKAFVAIAENDGPESSPLPNTLNPFGLTPAPSASAKSRDYLIGATVPFGSHTFIASYIRKDDRTGANNDASQVALGYTYALSKRTNLYAAWGSINNKRLASYTVGNNSEPGSGDKAINLGVRHIF